MDDTLKKRLLGAIVLVALGVIFIPALLDGSGYKARQARSIEIPPKPEIVSVEQTKLEPVVTPIDKKLEQVKQQKKQLAKAKDQTVAKLDAKPVKAWALQVSTSSLEKNAKALRDKLRKKGHRAYISTETSKGKTSYRVRIGPELDRKRVDALRERVKKQEGLDGFVVNHP